MKTRVTVLTLVVAMLLSLVVPPAGFAAESNWNALGGLGAKENTGSVEFSGKTNNYVIYKQKTDYKNIAFDLQFETIPCYMDDNPDAGPFISFVLSDLNTMSEYQTRMSFNGIYMVLYLKNDSTISFNVFANTPEAPWQAIAVSDIAANVKQGGKISFQLSEKNGTYTVTLGGYETSFSLPGTLGEEGTGYFHVGAATGGSAMDVGFSLLNFQISSAAAPAGSGGTSAKMPTDLASSPFASDIRLLYGLGIVQGYEDNTYRPENTLTRAEFTTQLMRLMGMDTASAASVSSFLDVAPEHWASGAIAAAYGAGLVNGTGGGYFSPEQTITYIEAVKMLVGATGYGYMAEKAGGYPNGYLSVGMQNGIMAGLSDFPLHTMINRGMAAKLIANTLEAPFLKETGLEDDSITYVQGKNITLLTEQLHIQKKTGYVRATHERSLDGEKPLVEGCVQIDGTIYYVNPEYVEGLIGSYVEYYVDSDAEENTILWIEAPERRNDQLTIEAEDISSVAKSGTGSAIRLTYFEGDKEETITIPAAAEVVLNGGMNYKKDVLTVLKELEVGSVRLLDNNNDGEYDVLSVDSYDVVIVDSVFLANEKITDLYGGPEVNLYNRDYTVTANGKKSRLSALKRNDVLLVRRTALTADDDTYTIENVAAAAEEYINETGSTSVKVGEKEYELSAYLQNLMDTRPDYQIKLNDYVKVYLDASGKVLYLDKQQGGAKNYTYLCGVDRGNSSILSAPKLKLFTLEGKLTVAELADNVSINGERKVSVKPGEEDETDKSTSEKEKLMLKYGLCDGNGIAIPQVILCNMNADGKIRSITTAGYDDFTQGVTGNQVIYTTTNNSLDSQVFLSASTMVMVVPPDKTQDKGFLISDSTYFMNDQKYNFISYDTDDFNNAPFVLVEGLSNSDAKINYKDSFVVGRISDTIYEDEIVKKVCGVTIQGYKEFVVPDETLLTDLDIQFGDVVSISATTKNEIVAISTVIAPATDFTTQTKSNLSPATSLRGAWNVMKGNVTRMDAASKKLVVNDSSGIPSSWVITPGNAIALVDTGKNEVKAGKIDDIGDNTYIIAIIQESVVKLMAVYK